MMEVLCCELFSNGCCRHGGWIDTGFSDVCVVRRLNREYGVKMESFTLAPEPQADQKQGL